MCKCTAVRASTHYQYCPNHRSVRFRRTALFPFSCKVLTKVQYNSLIIVSWNLLKRLMVLHDLLIVHKVYKLRLYEEHQKNLFTNR